MTRLTHTLRRASKATRGALRRLSVEEVVAPAPFPPAIGSTSSAARTVGTGVGTFVDHWIKRSSDIQPVADRSDTEPAIERPYESGAVTGAPPALLSEES